MLTHPTLDQLHQLGFLGIAQAFAELEAAGDAATLGHADWLGLLLDREVTHRRDKRLAARLRYARLRQYAVIEDASHVGRLPPPKGRERDSTPKTNRAASGVLAAKHDRGVPIISIISLGSSRPSKLSPTRSKRLIKDGRLQP